MKPVETLPYDGGEVGQHFGQAVGQHGAEGAHKAWAPGRPLVPVEAVRRIARLQQLS